MTADELRAEYDKGSAERVYLPLAEYVVQVVLHRVKEESFEQGLRDGYTQCSDDNY